MRKYSKDYYFSTTQNHCNIKHKQQNSYHRSHLDRECPSSQLVAYLMYISIALFALTCAYLARTIAEAFTHRYPDIYHMVRPL